MKLGWKRFVMVLSLLTLGLRCLLRRALRFFRIGFSGAFGLLLLDGFGLGLFVATPWIATNVMFSQRPRSLIWMDGVYPTVGCALMGLILTVL